MRVSWSSLIPVMFWPKALPLTFPSVLPEKLLVLEKVGLPPLLLELLLLPTITPFWTLAWMRPSFTVRGKVLLLDELESGNSLDSLAGPLGGLPSRSTV